MKTFTPRFKTSLFDASRFRAARTALLIGCAAMVGTSLGCNGSSSIPNLTQSAAALPGKAAYVGPRMSTARYSHSATSLEDGSVLVVGGTDERHLTGLSTVEIFDQSARVDLSLPVPESISGDFIDQDIDGNLIELVNGGRFWHTADPIDDGNVLIIGGTSSLIFGAANDTSEIYDPLTRSFSNPDLLIDPDNDIDVPRIRHATERLPSGKLLVSGGQESLTIITPGTTLSQDAYPSTKSIEIFDPAALSFEPAIDNLGDTTAFTNSRGRTDHVAATWAGFDNLIGTGDDVIGFVGGFQTLSADSGLAPEDLFPWSNLHTTLTSMDFYFAASGGMSLAQGVVLTGRQDGHLAMNLGAQRQATPFGDFGVANIVLVFGGDSGVPGCPTGDSAQGGTVDSADRLVATFTGFGPANGARFTLFNSAGDFFGIEEALGSFEVFPGICGGVHNRSEADAVVMDMTLVADGQPYIGSVIVTAGGYDQSLVNGACVRTVDNSCYGQQEGFVMYQPFFDIQPFVNGVLAQPMVFPTELPWEFEANSSPLNPLGIQGAWLNYDADIPNGDTYDGLLTLDDANTGTVTMNQGRVFHTLSRIPGEDGLLGNLDDRIVVIGGSNVYHPFVGDDAVSNSSEIFLPPEAGALAP